LPFEFHENMVIWKREEGGWDGLGFLGEGKHGKTPLSFSFALSLFRKGVTEIRVFDDCFRLEHGRIEQCRAWGDRDQLAEAYYKELSKTMNDSKHSVVEVEPGDHTYILHDVVMYLLLFNDTDDGPKRQRCGRQEFVEKLMPTNPFCWNYPKPGKDILLQRLKENWSYFIVKRPTKTTKELVDVIVHEAFEDIQRSEYSRQLSLSPILVRSLVDIAPITFQRADCNNHAVRPRKVPVM